MSATEEMDQNPILNVCWKTHIALLILATPSFRFLWGRYALKHLQTQVILEPRTIAFLLLTRLGHRTDPVYVWNIFNLLRSVPNEVFEDKWVTLALNPIKNIPGKTVQEQIECCDLVILQSFGLWKAVGDSAKAGIDFDKFKTRI